MNKTKEHGSDVHQTIVELHKIDVDVRKIAKELKIDHFDHEGNN